MPPSPISGRIKSMSIAMEFDMYRRLFETVDHDLQQKARAIQLDLTEHDRMVGEEGRFNATGAFLQIELDDVGYFRDTSMTALFVGAWAVFEFRLLEVCQYAKVRSGKSDYHVKSNNYSIDKAKKDLKAFCVPLPAGQFNELERLKRIRNHVVHDGGNLTFNPQNRFCKYLEKEQIIDLHEDPDAVPPSSEQLKSRAQLAFHETFCTTKLAVLRKFLLEVLQACGDKYPVTAGLPKTD